MTRSGVITRYGVGIAANSAAKSTPVACGTRQPAGSLMAALLPARVEGARMRRPWGSGRLSVLRWAAAGGPHQRRHQPGEGYGMSERVVVRAGEPDDPR